MLLDDDDDFEPEDLSGEAPPGRCHDCGAEGDYEAFRDEGCCPECGSTNYSATWEE